ncbi:hypothetical protein D0T53_03440 [Dysgonomonas sp. 216]|uniref:hypothetical protein n=1 Tax=Dysgonomonas sp. 216 TaxID=2302934 RepID=UPI0013D04A6A|nr:hypothetical protein [Dysgonomonas sp. 216]NDW17970.1 hypothetical protein [Dysgonomonas sp. 216]
MKQNIINHSIRIVLFMLFSVSPILAQDVNIENMTEEKRNILLINTAKEICKTYPDFYRENAPVKIDEKRTVYLTGEEVKEVYLNPDSPWYGMKSGQIYYSVTFLQDEEKDNFEQGYLARIYIRADTGKAFRIMLGCNIAYPVK